VKIAAKAFVSLSPSAGRLALLETLQALGQATLVAGLIVSIGGPDCQASRTTTVTPSFAMARIDHNIAGGDGVVEPLLGDDSAQRMSATVQNKQGAVPRLLAEIGHSPGTICGLEI
jgi:hypothetical protein